MTEVIPPPPMLSRDKKSRSQSPSVSTIGGTCILNNKTNRRIRVIDGNFLREEKSSSPVVPPANPSVSPPVPPSPSTLHHHQPVSPSLSSSGSYYPVSIGDQTQSSSDTPLTRLRSMTSPPELQPFLIKERHSRDPSDTSLTSVSDDPTSFSQSSLAFRPRSPSAFSWRSSTSSIADTSLCSLVNQQTSEATVLHAVKKQMMESLKRNKDLHNEVSQIPKLKKDIADLTKGREKLMNEMLDQNAIILQLKQRISLLHEQNQELAKIAQTDTKGSVSAPILAIRNTLITTLEQLKHMENQVQAIPTLKTQIRELTEENTQLKEKEQQLVLPVPELPEGVSGSQYQAVLNENEMLRETNDQLVTEVSAINKQLKTLSENCDGLGRRMELFNHSNSSVISMQDRIRHLEAEKDALYQQMMDVKIHGHVPVDLDIAHLNKKVSSLKRINGKLKSKIEDMKLSAKEEKERLVVKLFELELVNVKSTKMEMEKKAFDIERFRISQSRSLSSSISPSPQPSRSAMESDEEHGIRSLSPDSQLQLLKFKQLEIHNQETHNMLQSLLTERQVLEAQIGELHGQLEEMKQSKSEQLLEEAASKLEIAQERISSLEGLLKASKDSAPEGTDGSGEQVLKEKLQIMQGELQRLSKKEREAASVEGRLEQSKFTNEKLRHDKNRLEKKSREGRHRLKTLANELTKSVELVKNYQRQCMDMESDLEKANEELKSLKETNATLRAELQVKRFDLENHGKTGSNGAAATMVEEGVVSELQEKYSQLLTDLTSLTEKHKDMTGKLNEKEKEIENLRSEVHVLAEKEEEATNKNVSLSERNECLEKELEIAMSNGEKVQSLTDSLSEKAKVCNELEIQLKELKEIHEKLSGDLKTSHDTIDSLNSQKNKMKLENESLQQKVEILSNEAPLLVKQSTELEVAKNEAERQLESIQNESTDMKIKLNHSEEQFKKSETLNQELRSKLRILQADIDEAESKLDRAHVSKELLKKQLEESKGKVAKLSGELKTKEEYIQDGRKEMEREKERVTTIEKQLVELQTSLELEQTKGKALEQELKEVREIEISKLHSELSKTVSEMGQLTTDYTSRLSRIRELESNCSEAETQKDSLNQKLKGSEKEVLKAKQDIKKKDDEIKELKTSQASIMSKSRAHGEEVKKLKDEVYQYQLQRKKNEKDYKTVKDECSLLKEQSKMNQSRLSDAQKALQASEKELIKTRDSVAVQNKELESTKKKMNDLETQCEMLVATRDNLLNRLDRMEKLEMEHDLLKHKVQEALGQSSQLRNDNKALLQLLEGIETERPTFEKEATRNLQEENNELHQQVSLLSQWNDKHQKAITTLEVQSEQLEEEKRQILVDLMKMQSHEQENKQLKKELGEVEMEVNRLRRQAHTELLHEEMKVKLEAQGQLLMMFDEHNKLLQTQVVELTKQVKELGGQLARDKPVSPPPMHEAPTDLQFVNPELTRRCSELEVLNASLQEKVIYLEAELSTAQEISPKVRRRSSALLAASSIPAVPMNDEAFISVPEEMLLPCSILADAYINKSVLPESLTEKYLKAIGEGWFGMVGQKQVTADHLQGYITTFGRLSQQLLKLIVNISDMRGNTALHHTLANGNFPAVQVLLDLKCCNSNSTNKAGYTPLMLGAAHNIECSEENKSIMQNLLNKTDLNIRSKVELQTALMLAVSSGSVELVSMFIDAKADVNAQDKDGSTALMFACEKGNEEIVKKLLTTPNCNLSLKDNDSQTAYDIASSYSHTMICNHLKRHMKSRKK